MKLEIGQPAPRFTVEDIYGTPITLEQYHQRKLLLSFYRSPSCPLCSLRLHYLIQHYPHLQKKGLDILIFFEATIETVFQYAASQHPAFPLIADPDRKVFHRYHVEPNWLGLRGMLRIGDYYQAWQQKVGGKMTNGAIAMIPADFLIGPNLVIQLAHYGNDIGDHLHVRDIEHFAETTAMSNAITKKRVSLLGNRK